MTMVEVVERFLRTKEGRDKVFVELKKFFDKDKAQ